MSVEKPQARVFYERQAIGGGWSVRQLDRQISTQFFERTSYLAVSTVMWRRAADFWADARQHGLPSGSPAGLDADVLVVAQQR